jgi:hypothetical protein
MKKEQRVFEKGRCRRNTQARMILAFRTLNERPVGWAKKP